MLGLCTQDLGVPAAEVEQAARVIAEVSAATEFASEQGPLLKNPPLPPHTPVHKQNNPHTSHAPLASRKMLAITPAL